MFAERINLKSIIAILLLLLYAVFNLTTSLSSILLYIAVPGSALLAWLGNKDRSMSRYMKLLTCFFLWITVTSPFACRPEISYVWLRRLVGVYLLCVAVHQLGKNMKLIPWVYLIWCVMYIVCLIYARGQMVANDFDYTAERMNDSTLNANTFGYYTFFFTYIIYYFGEIKYSRFKLLSRLLFLLTIPLSFYIAIITASRQILLVQVPLISCLLYLRYIKVSSGGKRTVLIIGLVVAAIITIPSALDIYSTSYLAERSNIEVKEDVRVILIDAGIQTGLEHPITGVGVGCFGIYNYGSDVFTHNTYVELFATTGIIGLLFFVYIICLFIFRQWNMYKTYRDDTYLLFLVIGLIYMLDNMFYVFHTDPWLMAFFIFLSTHAETYYLYNSVLASNIKNQTTSV